VTRALIRQILFAATAILAVVLLSSCGTTAPHVTRRLPAFEPPIAKADFQTVRTTAYTHTESDHLEYGNRNALGGELRAATAPSRRAEYVPRTSSVTANADLDYQFAASSAKHISADNDAEDEPAPKAKAVTVKRAKPAKEDDDEDKPVRKATAVNAKPAKSAKAAKADTDTAKKSKEKHVAKKEKGKARDEKAKPVKRAIAVKKAKPPVIGSAAADWARWPVGTTFRLLSTGQVYRVDDTGWALSGRNTIDLYMANAHDMNTWGTRAEKIQVLNWGDPEESARLLASRQDYKHARRMLLEISGRYDEAAQLQ
jgi:3D (Asp-Asp-Asp) domain-containing protein